MPTPEAATLAHERLLQMEWSIAKLKQKAGSLVRDAYQLGYSYEEVALRHGVPLNTVRTSLRRSLAQLTVHGLAFEAA